MPYDPFHSKKITDISIIETQVRRIRTHGPSELVFIPVSARGFALFTQQDIGQLRKGLGLYYK